MDDLACFIEKRAHPDAAERILGHLDDCQECRLLLAATLGESPPEIGDASFLACTPRTFPVGEVVGGRYRIVRMISRGGMGEVYEAWDVQLSESVALKTIVCTGLDNAALYIRIRKEVQLARKVTHPNVCRILEFGLHQQSYRSQIEVIPFFTMELLSGETLADYVDRRGRVPTAELFPIINQVLSGLMAIHAAGIVHRDLKPENIFVLNNGASDLRVVVMDFGLARFQDTLSSVTESSSGSMVGTPSYMAPEQALGGTPSVAWDIYSLGVVLFRVIAGELPFTGNTPIALALARVRNPAPSLSSVLPGVDPGVEHIVARCLERNPAHRYASMEEIHCAINQPHSRGPQRRPAQAIKVVALVAGICAALGGGSWLTLRQLPQRESNAGAPRFKAKMVSSNPTGLTTQQTAALIEPPMRRLLSETPRGVAMPGAGHETESARRTPADRRSTLGARASTFRGAAIPASIAFAKKQPSPGTAGPPGSSSTGVSLPRAQSEDEIAIPVFAGTSQSARGRGEP